MTSVPDSFAYFMAGPVGRGIRIVVGLALIGWGWSLRAETRGVVLIIVGLVPLLAGLLNICLIAPLIGAPFSGRVARAAGRSDSGRA